MKQTRLIKKPLPGISTSSLLFVLLILFVIVLIIQNSVISVVADDEDDEDEEDDDFEDISENLAWASVGLFVVSSVYVLLYQAFRITRKFSDEGNMSEFKNNYRNFFLKIRKPLLYIHYIAGLAALVTLLIHGILLTKGDDEPIAVGWATAGIYIFYILTGVILWLKVKPLWSWRKVRKSLLYIHRSLLLFAIVIIIHIVHVAIAD